MQKRAVRIRKRAVLPGKWSSRRRKFFALILAGALALAGLIGIDAVAGIATAGSTQADVPAPRPGWTKVFSDSFNGPAGSGLDSANWIYDTGTGYQGGSYNWGTGEVETATDSPFNVHLDGNGHLVITPVRDSSGHWTSGRVETRRTDFAAPPGGELELSASLQQPDPANGLGYWPAFWALGAAARPAAANNWPSIGELDMMEDVNGLSQHSSTFHCGVDPGGPCDETNGIGSGLQACSGCQTGYHTYSVIVDRTNTSDEQLRFYLDGTQTYSIDQHQVDTATWQAAVDHGFFAIFDLAIGGSYPDKVCGCTSPSPATTSGAGMSVDWFAAYEKSNGAESNGAMTPKTSGTPSSPTTSTPSSRISADSYSTASWGSAAVSTATGDTDSTSADSNQIAQLSNGAYLRYDNVDFGSTGSTQFNARVASGAATGVSGLVDVVLDNPGNPPIGSFALANTGGWTNWQTIPTNITKTTGAHTVYLMFHSGTNAPYASLRWFAFPGSAP
jgi:hypothetical protein